LCEKYNVLLIIDEVQTGLGRTGKLMGYMHDLGDVKPDIVSMAKALSGGISPVSGIVANDPIMMTIKPGDHGSTFGGNSFGMAVAKVAVSTIIEEEMVANSEKMGSYLLSELKKIESPTIKEVRGRGLFVGLEFHHNLNINGNHFAKILMKNGLLTKATHDHCIRFSPALVIKKDEIDEAVLVI